MKEYTIKKKIDKGFFSSITEPVKEVTLSKNISKGGFFGGDKVDIYMGNIYADGNKRVQYCRVSDSLRYFSKGFMNNYSLPPVRYKTDPVIMFGMYTITDYIFFARHQAPIILVWCGSDSSKFPAHWTPLLKTKTCKHVTTHIYGSRDLAKRGIDHEVWPLTPGKIDLQLAPRGDNVYWYGHEIVRDFYGWHYLNEIEGRTKIKIIRAGPTTYSKAQLTQVYRNCFLALRLTPRDGVPTTVLEMGFMGRKSIFNGAVPHNIHWKGVDDICENVMKEYEDRKNNNAYIAEDIRRFLDIGDKWMYI